MRTQRRGFRWLFIHCLAWLAALGLALERVIDRRLNRIDPFDNRGIALFHVRRFRHRVGLRGALALACVALAVAPGGAMPVFAAHGSGAIQWVVFHPIGLLGATSVMPTRMAGGKAPQLLPFRYGTVRRRINIGNFAMQPGTQLPSVTIPQVGMLARVLFDIELTYTPTAALTIANLDGVDALIASANIVLNNGSAQIVSLSGVGINAVNGDLGNALPIKRGAATAGAFPSPGLPLASGGPSFFSYKGFLPVNANQRRQFEMGLINLQAPELRATIGLTFNPLSQVFTNATAVTAFTGSINLSYEYYEIPDLTKYQMPALTLIRTIEDAPAAINATGQQIYQLPRLGTMFDYHGVLVLNGLYANVIPPLGQPQNGLTEFAVRYNKTDTQYDTFTGDWETYEAEAYGRGLGPVQTPGPATPLTQTSLFPFMLSWNLWSASDRERNGGDFRDSIDTEENTTTEIIISVGQAVVLHAGKDYLFHVRRVVQKILQAPAPTQPMAQG